VAKRGITIQVSGDYTDRDIKRAIRDLGTLEHSGPRVGAALKKVGIGFGIAAAAATVFAAKIGIDAVRAAMDDEKSVAALSRTLQNLGMAYADPAVEKFIDDMQYQSNFADDELRPAFDRLIRSTRDVGEAQTALGVAMDIAQSKGMSVDAVAKLLARGYDGNTTALSRLGIGLDKATLKSMSMEEITRRLAGLFDGQAKAATETYAGKIGMVKKAGDELQETLGYGILDGFIEGMGGSTGSTDDLVKAIRDAQPVIEAFGQMVGSTFAGVVNSLKGLGGYAMGFARSIQLANDAIVRSQINVRDFLGIISDEEADRLRRELDAADAGWTTAMANYQAAMYGASSSSAAAGAASNTAAAGMGAVGDAAGDAAVEVDSLGIALDRLYGRNRSRESARLNLSGMRARGPNQSGSRIVSDPSSPTTVLDRYGIPHQVAGTKQESYSTKADVRLFLVQYAQAAQDYAVTLTNPQRQRAVLLRAQRYIASMARRYGIKNPEAFARRLIGVPKGYGLPGKTTGAGGGVTRVSPQARGEGVPSVAPPPAGPWNPPGFSPPATAGPQARGEGSRGFAPPGWGVPSYTGPKSSTSPGPVTFDDYNALVPTGGRSGGTTVNIGTVTVTAETPAEAVESARQWARMKAAGVAGSLSVADRMSR